MDIPVVITTSGTGDRLGELTKYTNKSLVKVGDKYAICYIIEKYSPTTEFIITLGYYGNHVKEFLLCAYPDRSFKFIDIYPFKGEGSSLGYSLLQVKKYLSRPFIFHCCDAIVLDSINITNYTSNILYVSKSLNATQYATVSTCNNDIIWINKKGSTDFEFAYTGVSYIYNYLSFWNNLTLLYNENPTNTQLGDVDVVQRMLNEEIHFSYKVFDDWYDTGNLDSYCILKNTIKSKITVIEKNYESICFFDDKVIKFINDKIINKKRYERGLSLYPLSPKILAYTENFLMMKRINGNLLSNVYNRGEIYKLLIWGKQNLWIDFDTNDKYIDMCNEFYIEKTIKRINNLPFLMNEKNIINGKKTTSVFELLTRINKSSIFTNTFCTFHGDFILDNILKVDDTYVLLDWRHEFGNNELLYGDMYYDLAKLHHNMIFNHENINNNLFTFNQTSDNVIVDLKCNYFLIEQLNDFYKFVNENSLDMFKIKILTAIIWLNMSSLYESPLRDFLFYFGKYNLSILLS